MRGNATNQCFAKQKDWHNWKWSLLAWLSIIVNCVLVVCVGMLFFFCQQHQHMSFWTQTWQYSKTTGSLASRPQNTHCLDNIVKVTSSKHQVMLTWNNPIIFGDTSQPLPFSHSHPNRSHMKIDKAVWSHLRLAAIALSNHCPAIRHQFWYHTMLCSPKATRISYKPATDFLGESKTLMSRTFGSPDSIGFTKFLRIRYPMKTPPSVEKITWSIPKSNPSWIIHVQFPDLESATR